MNSRGASRPRAFGVYLAGAKALYAALRWSGATDSAPFADVKVAVDKTPAWEKREAYTQMEVHWLECCSEGVTLLVIILGAHAGLERVPVIVHEIDDAAAANLAVLDNLHRADLNPIEETEAILQLVQSSLVVDRVGAVAKVRAAANVTKGRPQEGIDDEELTALRTLFDRSIGRLAVMSFANARLPLLGLPEEIYRAVLEGCVAYTVATPLKAVKDEDRRRELLQRAIEEGLTREQVKRLVAEANEPPVSIRDLEGRMKPARHLISTTQLRELPLAKRREFVRLVEEFVSRAEVLLGDVREISEV